MAGVTVARASLPATNSRGAFFHTSNFDQDLAELHWITLLRTMVRRPHLLGAGLCGVVLNGALAPFNVLRVEQVCTKESWFDDRYLDAELLDLLCHRQRKALKGELRRPRRHRSA